MREQDISRRPTVKSETLIETNGETRLPVMKKPTRSPPPPPLPPHPRRVSPARSLCSLPHQTSCSEYDESVCSVPFSTRSLQPHLRSNSPTGTCYLSCRSESAYSVDLNPGSSCCQSSCCPSVHSYSTTRCESQCGYNSPHHNHCGRSANYRQHFNGSPCTSSHSQHSQLNTSLNCGSICSPILSQNLRHCDQIPHYEHHCYRGVSNQPRIASQNRKNTSNNNGQNHNISNINGANRHHVDVLDGLQAMAKSLPPIPKERVSRPRRSVSPLPQLKRDHKQRDKCQPNEYMFHVEKHILRIHKYLEDREQRRQKCEEEIIAAKCPQNAETILTLLAKKESQYLRSLRVRISRDDFQEIQKLGAGFIGKVWLVRKLTKGFKFTGKSELYAMKMLKKTQVFQQNHQNHVIAERDILAEADNEWIVKLYYSFQDSQYLYFILEYIPGGDMMNLLCVESVFPEEWASFYIAEISLALQFVHDMGFIHRDIKPDNILIDANGHIKLTDFGLCTDFRLTHDSSYYNNNNNNNSEVQNDHSHFNDDHPTITKALTRREIEHSLRQRNLSVVGSPNYIAPEVLNKQSCRQQNSTGRLCDWWSVGVILYEMVIGYCPFIDLQKLKQGIYEPGKDLPIHIQYRIINWKNHLNFPSPSDPDSPPLMKDRRGYERYIRNDTRALIQGLLCDPQDRLCQNGVKDIQDHPFFKGINWQNIRSCQAPFVPQLRDELDTSHFEQFSPCEMENIFGSGTATKMPNVNGFTYKSYWKT